MTRGILRHGRTALVWLILAWGVLALIVRLATPLLELAHRPLEAWLGEQVGQPVRFARLEASWWGIGPRLRLHQLQVGRGAEALQLRQVDLDLSHWSLLRGQILDALRMTLDGLHLKLVRDCQGRLHVEGFPARQQGGAAVPLPRHLRLRHVRLEWQDRKHDRPPVLIDPLDLDLVRRGNRLRLRGHLTSPLGKARFGADIDGFLTTEDWHGSSYLKLEGLDMATLLRGYLPAPLRLRQGRLDAEIWQEWAAAREQASQGRVRLRDLRLDTGRDRALALSMLRGELDYRRADDRRWRILFTGGILRLSPDDAPIPLEAAVARSEAQGAPRLDAAISRLPLRFLSMLTGQSWPALPALPNRLLEGIDGMQPRGELRQLRLRWSPGHTEDPWALDASVHRVAIRPWQAIPGVIGLSGHLVAHPRQVDLTLEGEHLQLDYRRLFRWPHSIGHLAGRLHWWREPSGTGGWHLTLPRLQLQTPDTTARLWLQLAKADDAPLRLDLRAQLDQGAVGATPRYLPSAIMDEQLVRWLDHSLGSGRLEGADLLVSGPLADFPFDRTRNGVFEVLARVRDAEVDYRDGWPPLKGVDARLAFRQNGMQIDLLDGRIYQSRIRDGQVRIERLAPVTPLQVKATLEGPLEDELRLLRSPALSDRFGALAGRFQASGQARLDLDLQIPLAARHAGHRLDARLGLRNSRVRLPDWDLEIERLSGTLQVSLEGVTARELKGNAFGRPVTIDVARTAEGDTRILAKTRWDVPTLQRRFRNLPLQLANGESDFSVQIDIPQKKKDASLSIRSQLAGMRLDLPPPLGKPAAARRRFELSLPLGTPPGPVHLRYGARLDARFTLDGSRSELRYDRGEARLPDKPMHRVIARLPRLDVGAWQELAEHLDLSSRSATPPPWELNLATEVLVLGALELPKVRIHASHHAEGEVEARVEGPRAEGRLHYRPENRGLLLAEFERLHLPYRADGQDDTPPPDPAGGLDPRHLPQVDLRCKDLRLAKARLGAARLVMRPEDRGARIVELGFEGPDGLLEGQGNWLWEEGRAHTWLNGLFEGGNLGGLLAGLGYPRVMEKGRARIRFDLDWPGHPLQLHRGTLHGTAEIDLRNGRLSALEPGISRVLGLLSLDALKRRLKLDFGDLLKKGYSFDRITGSFLLGDGQAQTRDLVVDGPSGRIEFGGRIGLEARDFDSVVQVTPKLDATLVVASTIAGGPVAGAATFLAQRLLSDEVDRINRFEYSVTGSWDEPRITPLDSGGPLSKIVNTLGGRKSEAKTEAQEEAIDERRTQPPRGLIERLFGRPGQPAPQEPPSEGDWPNQR